MKAQLDIAWSRFCREYPNSQADMAALRHEKSQTVRGFTCKHGAEDLFIQSIANWARAVGEIFGKDATLQWTDTGCIVQGVMEFLYVDLRGDNHVQKNSKVVWYERIGSPRA